MKHIRKILKEWYSEHHRTLPWRATRDPYLIWLSEIILQQTRVAQGLDYYLRFKERYADVSSLALAEEEEVLKMWQGLGYYSRARNLHAAARQVMEDFSGEFPGTYSDLLKLKGVGPYTASAIASIANGEARAVVDGNVERVLSRLFDISDTKGSASFKRKVDELAMELVDVNDPGMSNQALMEFGAMQCLPKNPVCHRCHLSSHCMAFQKGTIAERPVSKPKKASKHRYFNYLNVQLKMKDKEYTLLKKRESKDIWQHLWEFPLYESTALVEPDKILALDELAFLNDLAIPILKSFSDERHILSHQVIWARFFHVEIELKNELPEFSPYTCVERSKLDEYPISRLIERYLDKRFVG